MPTTKRNSEQSPFHAGEQYVQEKLGVRERMESFGRRVIRDFLPEQHRSFYRQLPFATIGHVDREGRPWASIVVGHPGFISTPDARSMRFAGRPVPGDPLARNLRPGLQLGILGMDPSSRRRNRLSGRVTDSGAWGFELSAAQVFGNCPQYIQSRSLEFVREPGAGHDLPPIELLAGVDDDARTLIESSDTFFVASASSDQERGPAGGADASHRGGRPGFVGVQDDGSLIIPDYSGNNHFNTLGNFVANPVAGLLFIDFARGDLLMLSGRVEIVWEGPQVSAYRGAERLWKFYFDRGLRLRDRLPVRWRSGEASPHNALTGTWNESKATLEAEASRDQWRPYTVASIVDESDEIRSFYLSPADGGALPTHLAGQHLPIRITPAGGTLAIQRSYTLSSAPGDPHYRISVKREPNGLVSRHLHAQLQEGGRLEAKAPRGQFFLDATERRPAVLLAGGVGVTPMISMLRHVVKEGIRTRHTRETMLFHAARTTASRGFFAEAKQLAALSGGAVRTVSVIGAPTPRDEAGADFHDRGRITVELLRRHLPLDDYDFYLCGPGGFMQAMYDALRELGVADSRVYAEAFGPSALTRTAAPAAPTNDGRPAVAEQAIIEFAKAGFEMPWTAEDGSLLELAERHGLSPEFGCRAGSCGSCAVRLREGHVTYERPPTAQVENGQALICCARPAASGPESSGSAEPMRVVLDL